MIWNLGIFISHSWGYDEHYERIAGWFAEKWTIGEQREPLLFYDYSVPKSDPVHARTEQEIGQALARRIDMSDVVIVPTAMYGNHSEWMQRELEYAKRTGRSIVAVNPWGQERKAADVVSLADRVVGWNKESVVNAVWDLGRAKARRT